MLRHDGRKRRSNLICQRLPVPGPVLARLRSVGVCSALPVVEIPRTGPTYTWNVENDPTRPSPDPSGDPESGRSVPPIVGCFAPEPVI